MSRGPPQCPLRVALFFGPILGMIWRALVVLMLVASCTGRPLTDAEIAFSQKIHGDQLDTSRVRLIDGAP
ncbi:MAG: hypothetical protein AAFQ60_17810, partial [Pseudomonadota bacterium]